jgi:hypothetical protein
MPDVYNTYDVGDLIRLEALISISGSYLDPDYLALEVNSDVGREEFVYGQTGTFIKQEVGKYYLNYFITQSGQYSYRFFSSGTAWGAELKRFVVRR